MGRTVKTLDQVGLMGSWKDCWPPEGKGEPCGEKDTDLESESLDPSLAGGGHCTNTSCEGHFTSSVLKCKISALPVRSFVGTIK